jgi:hypothetical protein
MRLQNAYDHRLRLRVHGGDDTSSIIPKVMMDNGIENFNKTMDAMPRRQTREGSKVDLLLRSLVR